MRNLLFTGKELVFEDWKQRHLEHVSPLHLERTDAGDVFSVNLPLPCARNRPPE